ncbi:MAG TPA: guanylate kinase [Terriglobales bacterium]|nr:guanylate kinase [Terriglobales bacterium]
MSGIVYIISAPSGSGKTTLSNELLRQVPDLEFSISYTTRKPRGKERNGREYFFVSSQEFERMIEQGQFLEYARVFGDYYGTARRFLDEANTRGKDLLLDIDVQGAHQIKEKLPDAVSIFILPPSREVLEKRLRERSTAEHISGAVIERRLQAAAKEIANYRNYDYILINDRLDESQGQLKAIVLAERLRRSSSRSTTDSRIISKAEECRLKNAGLRAQQILASFGFSTVPSSH